MSHAAAATLTPLARAVLSPARLARLPRGIGQRAEWLALRYAVAADGGGLGALPAAAAARLRAAYAAVLAANLSRYARLDAILDAARAERLPLVVLKGAALGRTLYGDPGVRAMVDLDLACAPEDAERAASLVARLGFRRRARPARRLRRDAVHDIQLVDGDVWLELHFRLWHELALPNDVRGLIARAAAVPFGAARALVPSTADHLYLTLVHAATHGFCGNPLWLADAALLAASAHGDVWRDVWRLAEDNRALVPLAAAIDQLRAAFPELAPAARAAPGALRRFVIGLVVPRAQRDDGAHARGASRLVRSLLLADAGSFFAWAATKASLVGAGD